MIEFIIVCLLREWLTGFCIAQAVSLVFVSLFEFPS